MLAKLTSKGQITVPKAVRDQLGIKPGDALDFEFRGEQLEVKAVPRRSLLEFRGMFAVGEALAHEEERRRAWEARGRELQAHARDE